VVASVSKTEGPRFESWLPRSLVVVPYLLFFLAGLGFGYAAAGVWKWLPLAFPLLLALVAALSEGIDGTLLLRLAIALLVTAAGVALGMMLDPGQEPRRVEPGWR
jgi:hypothetical protein